MTSLAAPPQPPHTPPTPPKSLPVIASPFTSPECGAKESNAATSIRAPAAAAPTHFSNHVLPPIKHIPVHTMAAPERTPQTRRTPSPVDIGQLNRLLAGYPKRQYIIQGFTEGFSLHFEGEQATLSSSNSPTVLQNPKIVRDKLANELELGRIAGPFADPPLPNFKCSPLALREKQTPGRYRILHNLSFPYDKTSVNHNIPKHHSTVKYQTIQDAIHLIRTHSPSAFMAKSDIADAFRLIPVHPSQYHLLGFQFDGAYYYEKMLSMGAATSCKIFEEFSNALQWILREKFYVSSSVKVLDDFIFIQPTKERCRRDLTTFLQLCRTLSVPIAPHKTQSPATVLTFLGLELDSTAMQARLPQDKLQKYRHTLRCAVTSPKITLRQLKSLIGQLQFSTCVIPSGRPFLRRLHDLTKNVTKPHFHISLTAGARADLDTWHKFLVNYNGITLIHQPSIVTSPQINLCSDASKTGYGAVYAKNWIQGTWPSAWSSLNIAFLELYPIFLTLSIFAPKLAHSVIYFHTDNQAVVDVLNKQTAKCPLLMQVVRPLVLLLLSHNINLTAIHIPGINNVLCDSLSRQPATPNLLRTYGMSPNPTPIPPHLLPANYQICT